MVSGSNKEEFRRIYLPYCIEQVAGHGHVVLNRLYKPLGVVSRQHVEYAPYAVKLIGLTPAKAEAISWNGSGSTDHVFLYSDASVPTRSQELWDGYQRRLQLLSQLEVAAGTHHSAAADSK
ncbi:MAG: hypothetical protein ABIO17_06925 [Pseudoxanthomonas sp.]